MSIETQHGLLNSPALEIVLQNMQAEQEDTEREMIRLWNGQVFTLDLEGERMAVHAVVVVPAKKGFWISAAFRFPHSV